MSNIERLKFACDGVRPCEGCTRVHTNCTGHEATVFCDVCAHKIIDDALPALLAVAEQAKLAVEAGAIDEIYLSTIRGALAALEGVKL